MGRLLGGLLVNVYGWQAIFIVLTLGARTRSFAEKKWFGAVSEAKASTVGIFFSSKRRSETK